MNLYLIRHGDSQTDKPDALRSLTKAGVETVKKTAAWVTKAAEPPAIILSSPLKRALETAGYFSRGWNVKIEQVDWLHADVEPSVVIEELKKIQGNPPIPPFAKGGQGGFALVGHLPNLGLLMGVLLWGLPPKEIVLPKAGVAFLTISTPEVEPGSAKLRWLISSELIR